MSEHTAENAAAREATASAWREAAGIVETYSTVQEAATGLRTMADLLTRPIPPGSDADEGADQ